MIDERFGKAAMDLEGRLADHSHDPPDPIPLYHAFPPGAAALSAKRKRASP
jgi:hypothetical protein